MKLQLLIVLTWLLAGAALFADSGTANAEAWESRLCITVQTEANHSQWEWDGALNALQNAGISARILTICPRVTELWTAHVILQPAPGGPQLRAVIARGDRGESFYVRCVTTETTGCAKYGELPPSEILGWRGPELQ